MSEYHPFDPSPKKPVAMPPSGTCDSQFHVLGDPEKYPVRPGAGYQMPSATIHKALEMHKALGIERGVIVQATTYGLDHSVVLDGLAVAGPNYRGCAIAMVLAEKNNDAYIAKLHDAGVRGGRFNFVPQLNMMPSRQELGRVFDRMRELGWYAKIQAPMTGIMDSLPLWGDIEDIPVIIDHMARYPLADELTGPYMRTVTDLLKRDNFWMLLSNGYKLSKQGPPWTDMIPVARAFIDSCPNRVIWASDWPHPMSKTPPPNDGDLMDFMFSFTRSDEERRRILVDNPAALFGF